MAEQNQIGSSCKIIYDKGLYYVRSGVHTLKSAFTTKAKAEEFLNCYIQNKKRKLYVKLVHKMRKEPDIRKRSRMWKKICRMQLVP